MEEAAFMSPLMFAKIVVPLLGVDKTALLAISTPDDELNYYTNLMNVCREDGRPLFKTIRLGMACQSCEAAGIPCNHKLYKLPFWKPIARAELTSAILASMPELNARENLGQVVSSREYMCKPFMKAFRERPSYRLAHDATVVHIGIDPSGGGTSSDYAICSTVHDNGNYVIVGVETSSSHHQNDILDMLDNHLLALRRIPQYASAVFWFYIEANMSFLTVDDLRNHFLSHPEFGQLRVAREDGKAQGKWGVWTGEKEKEMYAKRLQKTMSEGKLHYAENFVSASRPAAESKAQLERQVANLRKEAKPCLEPGFDRVKFTYTGKSQGERDDGSMALQIALYNMEKQRNNPQFITSCMQQGLRY